MSTTYSVSQTNRTCFLKNVAQVLEGDPACSAGRSACTIVPSRSQPQTPDTKRIRPYWCKLRGAQRAKKNSYFQAQFLIVSTPDWWQGKRCGRGLWTERQDIGNAMIQMELATERPVESPSTIKRRLAAVAFADVAGFSRLIALNEVETLRRWKMLRTEIMAPHMERQGGRVTQTPGDAVLLEFPSVVNAVRWAADVQRTQRSGLGEADPFDLQLRIGINVEDVIDDDGILQGDGVNIASRIHQTAEPGQIVVTAAALILAVSKTERGSES